MFYEIKRLEEVGTILFRQYFGVFVLFKPEQHSMKFHCIFASMIFFEPGKDGSRSLKHVTYMMK